MIGKHPVLYHFRHHLGMHVIDFFTKQNYGYGEQNLSNTPNPKYVQLFLKKFERYGGDTSY